VGKKNRQDQECQGFSGSSVTNMFCCLEARHLTFLYLFSHLIKGNSNRHYIYLKGLLETKIIQHIKGPRNLWLWAGCWWFALSSSLMPPKKKKKRKFMALYKYYKVKIMVLWFWFSIENNEHKVCEVCSLNGSASHHI
jgi:hypothetical protein